MNIQSMELNGFSGHEAGLRLLEKMYREKMGVEMPQILRTSRGKPYFAEGDVHFSVSHTPRRVFCVLSDRSVGIDAEEMGREVNLKLAEKVLSPKEFSQFQQAEDKKQALLKFWVLKEAAAKLSGEGIQGYPNKTAFLLEDPHLQIMDNCFVAVFEE